MGVSDSPLRDRVVFVEGAPRSGTTYLSALLAAHPAIAGTTSESHLFDWGVGDLFDNFEGLGGRRPFLSHWIERGDLADLVRDLVDGVLERMRAATKAEARFALEKTPAARTQPEVALRRKLECFPDGWYIHIVRDGEAVTRSLMRGPWNPDRSPAACERWWREGVGAIRNVLGTQQRYRELRCEDLAARPVEAAVEIFGWLGLECDRELRLRIEDLARVPFADLGPAEAGDTPEAGQPRAPLHAVRRWRTSVGGKAAAGTARRAVAAVEARRSAALGAAIVEAMRVGDAERLRALTGERLDFTYRSSAGDLRHEGDEARAAILELGRQAFSARFLDESWSVGGRSPVVVLFSGVRPDGRRVDLSMSVAIVGRRVRRFDVISAGEPAGRPAAALASLG